MNNKKITSIILAAMLAITSFAGCVGTETKPDGAVDISEAESALISEMLESGMDESEIAEALSTFESEYYATSVSGNDSTESTSDAVTGESTTADVSQSVSGGNSSGGSTRNAAGNNGSTNGTTTANGRVVTPSSQNTNGTSGTTTTRPTSGTSATSQTTTASTTTTQAASASGTFKSSVEDELVGLINNLRKTAAVERQKTYYVPVQMTSSLRTKARTRAQEIVSNFSHTSASGIDLGNECCYKGGSDAGAINIFTTWKNSGSHKSSMCGAATSSAYSVKYCGIGVWKVNGQTYAVFGMDGGASGSGLPSGYTEPTTPTTPTTESTTAPTTQATTAPTTQATTAPTTQATTAPTTQATTAPTTASTQPPQADPPGDDASDG